MSNLLLLTLVNLRWIIRDRTAQALIGVALLLMVLIPVLSSFSMRQSQELSVTLSLSCVSLVLLVYSVFLGSSLLWREIERRYTFAVLALPISRGSYLVSKFLAIFIFLVVGGILLGICASGAIYIGTLQYEADFPVQWLRIALAIGAAVLKYALVAAISLAVSAVSTSFFMPFFTTIAVYLAGSASQGVFDYITSSYGQQFSPLAKGLMKGVYFLVPNFSLFDFTLQAVYPIPLDASGTLYCVAYFVIYTSLVMSSAVLVFQRKEMP